MIRELRNSGGICQGHVYEVDLLLMVRIWEYDSFHINEKELGNSDSRVFRFHCFRIDKQVFRIPMIGMKIMIMKTF